MVVREWNRAQDYAFTVRLDGAQWAWEFLRRNPVYQAEWRAFDAVWQVLEAQYGRPPDRDFCAWQQDPRAWVDAGDCPEGDCRIDRDRVLIECALGARWGFYKFPPDPADDDPVGAGRLAWRPVAQDAVLVGPADTNWLGGDPSRVALGFDLALPLRDQLERAKRMLQVLQRQRRRSGEAPPVSLRDYGATLTRMLRLLDAEATLGRVDGLSDIADDPAGLLDEAHRLRDGGYRRLPLLPA